VAIVNEAFARQLLPRGSAVGRRVAFGDPPQAPMEIVGVVADAIYLRPQDRVPPTIYLPVGQARPRPAISFVVAPRGPAAAVVASLREATARVHPEVTIEFRALDTQVGDALVQERVLAGVFAVFGVLGLVLAAVGLYGVMSFAVARRRRELGIRLALGAVPRRLHTLVLREVAQVTVLGVVFGLGGSFALARLARGFLFETEPTDGLTWLFATAALAATALAAGHLPARRAARVDPVTSLRDE
jgi:ABC-type antimicrobial peptide transport system permease subunit